MKKCVFAGTFDPITLGHTDIIKRALSLFDEVHVLVAVNPDKKCLIDASERVNMAKTATAKYSTEDKRIVCVAWERPLFEYCLKEGVYHIVKGVRNTVDFEYEKTLALQTKALCPSVETVLLYSDPSLDHISSSYVRGLIRYGMDVKGAVPEEIEELLLKK
ncbi:MAG: pantetheine-phosphate adenylyltransferase [Ruminococcaceae bacterium]|nr:pantetheine-phosphate adenylyltransferase [Oscillospiraceae bacterium]